MRYLKPHFYDEFVCTADAGMLNFQGEDVWENR